MKTESVEPSKFEYGKDSLPNKIELGCGTEKPEDSLGVDIVDTKEADKVFDLDKENWPLPSNHFSFIRARDVFEHLDKPINFLEEIHRIAKPHAKVVIRSPHISSSNWHDPTHKRLMGSKSLKNFTDNPDFGFYSQVRFKVKDLEIRFAPFKVQPHKHIGYWLANNFTELYESTFLRNLFPAKAIRFELEVLDNNLSIKDKLALLGENYRGGCS